MSEPRTASVVKAELEQEQKNYTALRRANDADKRRVKELEEETQKHYHEANRLKHNQDVIKKRIDDREANHLGTRHIVALMDELARVDGADHD